MPVPSTWREQPPVSPLVPNTHPTVLGSQLMTSGPPASCTPLNGQQASLSRVTQQPRPSVQSLSAWHDLAHAPALLLPAGGWKRHTLPVPQSASIMQSAVHMPVRVFLFLRQVAVL